MISRRESLLSLCAAPFAWMFGRTLLVTDGWVGPASIPAIGLSPLQRKALSDEAANSDGDGLVPEAFDENIMTMQKAMFYRGIFPHAIIIRVAENP